MNRFSTIASCFLFLWNSSLCFGEDTPLKFVWHKAIQQGSLEFYGLELDGKGKGKVSFKKRGEDALELDLELKPAKVETLLSYFVRADFLNETKNFVSSR